MQPLFVLKYLQLAKLLMVNQKLLNNNEQEKVTNIAFIIVESMITIQGAIQKRIFDQMYKISKRYVSRRLRVTHFDIYLLIAK